MPPPDGSSSVARRHSPWVATLVLLHSGELRQTPRVCYVFPKPNPGDCTSRTMVQLISFPTTMVGVKAPPRVILFVAPLVSFVRESFIIVVAVVWCVCLQ